MSVITLSFDNGPDPEITPQVLDVLRRHGIKATFFVVGEKLRDRRKFAERAHAEGHWIGNHTFNHQVPLGLCVERGMAAREIDATQRLIGHLAHSRRFFRPFGGGGIRDRRLLNREALQTLVMVRLVVCCGTSSRKIGVVRTGGWSAHWRLASRRSMPWPSCTICRPAPCGISIASSA